MHRIYAFSAEDDNGRDTFVVISALPLSDVIKQHSLGTPYGLDSIQGMVNGATGKGEPDAAAFPCDRRLRVGTHP